MGGDVKVAISIHAPLTGCDDLLRVGLGRTIVISIHAPLTGCDLSVQDGVFRVGDISIHAPLTGCDKVCGKIIKAWLISIHAPLTGCDPSFSSVTAVLNPFQSTHP